MFCWSRAKVVFPAASNISRGVASAPRNNRAWLRRCQPHHLFLVDCASIRRRSLSDLAQDHARREPDSAARNRRDPSPVVLFAARLRYFAILHGGEAHTGARLQLQRHALGRYTAQATLAPDI